MDSALLIAVGGETIVFVVLPMVGSILLAYGIYQVIVESREGHHKRVMDRLHGKGATQPEKSAESILRRSTAEDAAGIVGAFFGKLKVTPQVQTLLDQADVNWSASKMLANQVIVAVITSLVMIVLQLGALVALGSAVCVMFLPFMWLNMRRTSRMKRLTAQLPDVFEMMSQALRAGHSLASALEVVYDQLPDPVSSEFGRVFHEQNLGIKLEDALLSMANRVDSLDVRFFVTAVLIQRQTGGDLAEVLDKIGSVIRERIELFGMVQGLTAEGRLSGWVLFALPFVVFGAVMTLNPVYANSMFEDPTGRMLLMAAAGMQLLGLAMIRYIVNIKV